MNSVVNNLDERTMERINYTGVVGSTLGRCRCIGLITDISTKVGGSRHLHTLQYVYKCLKHLGSVSGLSKHNSSSSLAKHTPPLKALVLRRLL